MRRSLVTVALLVGSIVAIVVLAVAGSSATVGDDANPSSRSAGHLGTLALHDWFGRLGFDVHRVSGSFDLGGTDVLIVVEPEQSFSDTEVAAVDAMLRRGGTVILALDRVSLSAATPVLDHLGQAVVRLVRGDAATPMAPLDPAGAVQTVRPLPGSNWLDLEQGHGAPLLAAGGVPVMKGFSVGEGRAYVLGDFTPLTNEGLRVSRPDANGDLQPVDDDNAALALALVEHGRPLASPPLRIGFDEVHHGEGPSDGAGAILLTPLGLALLVAALAIVAFLAASGRRLGRPLPAGDPTRVPSAADFVRAMAQLYERSGHPAALADRYAEELKERVGIAAGVDPRLDDARFLAAIAGHGAERTADVAALLRRARALAVTAARDSEILALVRAIDAVEEQWTAGAPL